MVGGGAGGEDPAEDRAEDEGADGDHPAGHAKPGVAVHGGLQQLQTAQPSPDRLAGPGRLRS